MRSALPAAVLALTVAVLLTGCVPHDPEVAPPPEPTTEPVFATDEEALAAATDAYEAYLEMSNLIAQEGGENPERIAPYVTEEWLAEELDANKNLRESGRRLVGNIELHEVTLQQIFLGEGDLTTVVVYTCVDPSSAQLLDSSGAEVTPDPLSDRWTTEASFIADANSQLLLARDEPWQNDPSC